MTTRAERLTEELADYLVTADLDQQQHDEMINRILAIADDRKLISLKQFATRINRGRTTILSWRVRGNVVLPEPAYEIAGAGPFWDAEDIETWCKNNPSQVWDDDDDIITDGW